MAYMQDREFTNYVHEHLAVPQIYSQMDWVVQENNDLNERLRINIDMNNAVDYMAVNAQRRIVTIQERFREAKYSNYTDFTIRYMRPENIHEDRRMSEFFKLDSNYFIYGTIDTSKSNYRNARRFLKYAVLNLVRLKERIDDGTIIIDENLSGRTCRQEGNKMRCPVNNNTDHSSNFVPFDIIILSRVAPEVIEYQEGFIPTN